MQATLNYKDLAAEVEILKIRIKDLETEHKRLRKMMFANAPKGVGAVDYTKTRVTSSKDPYPLDEIVKRMNEIAEKLEPLYKLMEGKEETIKSMKEQIDKMDGLEQKIAFLKYIEGKSLFEISIKLGYSYDWIKKKSSKIGTKKALND